MDPHDPGVPRDATPGAEPTPAPSAGAPGTSVPAADDPKRGRLWAWVLAAGLLSGLIGWLVGEATLDLFRISEEASGEVYDFTQANIERRISNSRNASIAFGVLGATLGLTMGLAGGLARGKPGTGLIGGGLGLALAGAAGGLIPFTVVPLYFNLLDPAAPTLLLPLVINSAIWVPIGLAAGLAFGIGLGGRRRLGPALIGGLVGSVIGVAAFELINAVAYPLVKSDQFIPSAGPYSGDELDWERFFLLQGRTAASTEPGEQAIDQFTVDTATAAAQQRLIARLLVPLLIVVGIAWATQGPGRRFSKPAERPAT